MKKSEFIWMLISFCNSIKYMYFMFWLQKQNTAS